MGERWLVLWIGQNNPGHLETIIVSQDIITESQNLISVYLNGYHSTKLLVQETVDFLQALRCTRCTRCMCGRDAKEDAAEGPSFWLKSWPPTEMAKKGLPRTCHFGMWFASN